MRAKALEPVTLVRSPTFLRKRIGADVEGLESESRSAGRWAGMARGVRRRRRAMARIWSGGAAAAADDIDDARRRPGPDLVGQHVRRLVVAAEGIGQAGVGVGGNEAVADPRQFLDVLAQFLGAQGAVEAEGERRTWRSEFQNASAVWPDRVRPEASVMVPRPSPASAGRLRRRSARGEEGGLGVQGVEDRFDKQDVGAALDQAGDGLDVVGNQFVEADVAIARVVDVRAKWRACGWSGRERRRRSAAWPGWRR